MQRTVMIFESFPTTSRSDELIDKAFPWAACTGRAKQNKLKAQQSILQMASNILSGNPKSAVIEWPDFETVDPLYYELADTTADVGEA